MNEISGADELNAFFHIRRRENHIFEKNMKIEMKINL